MANHHYVPRFILRNFNEKISIFKLKTKELIFNKNLRNVFQENDLYSEDIENMFNKVIENDVAIVLRNKILIDSKHIEITRKELILLRKFLLLQMFRTNIGLSGFTKDMINKYRLIAKEPPIQFNEIMEISNLNDRDYWLATLKCIIECDNLTNLKTVKTATAIAVCFAEGYNSGYMGIWDSSECGEEFIVMDQGMTSEHEKSTPDYMYKDAMKRGYLLEKLENNHPNKHIYAKMFIENNLFHENFYFHSISKNRIIVLINPFFRLYNQKDAEVNKYIFEPPNIRPTNIFDLSITENNLAIYKNHGNYSLDDVFKYKIKQLTLRDAIYVNALTLDRIHNIVGFSELKNIRRSLITYNHIGQYRLKNYDALVENIEQLGYNIHLTNELKLFAKSFTTRIITSDEISYIKKFLELMERKQD